MNNNKSHIFLLLLLMIMSSVVQSADAPASQSVEPPKQTLFALPKPFPAPDFSLKGEDGTSYRLSDYKGKVVILNFWATWCPPCREEMPSMERAWQKVKDKGIVILAVDMGDSEDDIFQFFGDYPVTFPLPMDRDGSVTKKYPVVGLPTTFIVSPKGMVTHRAVGTREWEAPDLLGQLLDMREK